MTNMAVELALRERGVPLVRAKVGDRYVLEELAARGWQLGGEGSGHLLALDRHTTGDGIVSALQVLQAVRRSGGSLAALLDGVTLFPQTLINVRLPPARRLAAATPRWPSAPARRRARTGRRGRVLIRASGTEPVLRVMVEARDAAQAARAARSAWPDAALAAERLSGGIAAARRDRCKGDRRRCHVACHRAALECTTSMSHRHCDRGPS